MTLRGKIGLFAAAFFGVVLGLAPLGGAKAYDDYMTACRKWVGQGAGEQYKCFDCMKTVTNAYGVSHWVNTCADGYHGGGGSWGPGW